ncbi:menaquinone-dependent protoporphyrinogen IX dehydrogenase [Shewanella marina]|uniref:menaquinone-dependent protoporphyrinogen IX dehydrogenase n=1 Tax=Shewanella marina TaxID=487319 RepID=UPI00046FE6AB|nr:menaquinone-dependent protoporphyrinogen IX dehydrogenase [Shewanella marina]
MLKTLILYSTVDGQTLAICKQIQQTLTELGEQVCIVNLAENEQPALAEFDKVLIGASIRYGKYRPELFKFINAHSKVLDSKQNAFFSVNVVARKPNKNTPETNPYMNQFLKLSLWRPQQLAVFAGKIAYPQYRFFDRMMIRFIMWMTKGPTDISKVYEFTDWPAVKRFGQSFAYKKTC